MAQKNHIHHTFEIKHLLGYKVLKIIHDSTVVDNTK